MGAARLSVHKTALGSWQCNALVLRLLSRGQVAVSLGSGLDGHRYADPALRLQSRVLWRRAVSAGAPIRTTTVLRP